MAEIDRVRLAQVMAMAAAGVETAPVLLYQEFGLTVARALRHHLGSLGMGDIEADDLHGLTIDACIVLCECASGWRPDGGALPWVWAERRLRALAARFVGQWADPIDAAVFEVEASPLAGIRDSDVDELDLLRQLAADGGVVGLLAEALAAAGTERNQRILLAYRLQANLGDPSPANTTAARFAMTPPAVRQVVKRSTDRLRAVIAGDARFAPLADVPLAA